MAIGILTSLSPIYFSYIVMANFIGGGTENTQRMSLMGPYYVIGYGGRRATGVGRRVTGDWRASTQVSAR